MAHMDQRTTIYLVRHAESQPSAEVPEPAWPLSARGLAQAQALVPAMRELGIVAIYASPYLRAQHTVAPLAAALGVELQVVDALRERALGQLERGADHRAMVERYWADPGFALPDGESNTACTLRVAPAIAQLAARHRGDAIAIASHGNALALYLATLDPRFGFEQWRSMRNPDLFRVVHDGQRATWDGARLPTAIDA
jgi:2,3-bisphosphoglycerate-dependent phosphoglycerate mutase